MSGWNANLNAACQSWNPLYGPGMAITSTSITAAGVAWAGCQGAVYTPGHRYGVPMVSQCPAGYTATEGGCFKITQSHCTCSASAGDPIDLATGDLVEHAIDFETSGQHPFVFGRKYSFQAPPPGIATQPTSTSATNASTSFGLNWGSIIDRQFVGSGTTGTVYLEGGQTAGFASGVPSTGGRRDTLVQNSSTTWTWTSESGEIDRFTQLASGQAASITSITSVGGHTLTFTYDSSGVLQTIVDELGRTATVTWSAAGPVSQISFPDGVTLTYGYTAVTSATGLPGSNLTSVTRTQSGVSRTISYEYEDTTFPTALTGITDERGIRTATWAYDDTNARVTSSEGAGGANLTTVSYNDTALTRTVTNALGKQQVYSFSTVTGMLMTTELQGTASTHTPATTATWTYNSGGYPASYTDANGNVTNYNSYNAAGEETSRTEAYGTTAARTITTTWSTALPQPTEIVEPGRTTDYTYDTNGNVTAKTITDTTTFTTPYSTNGRTRGWTFAYTTAGLLHTVTDPKSNVTTYAYNSSGFLSSVTDALSHETQITATNGRGKPTTIVDPNGITTTLTYDIDDRTLTITVNPGASQSEYQFSYTDAGDVSQITLPAGGYLQYTYDNARRVTQVENARSETETFTYNANGDQLSAVVKDASSSITKQETATYDELGRTLQAIGASSQTWGYAYDKDNNLTQVTDPLSNVRQTAFDALNRVITQTDPLTNTVQYAYNATNNLTELTDGRSLATPLEVDGFGEVIQEVSPDRGTRQYWYDADGNLTKWIDGDSEETDFTFDADNRRTGMTFPTASAEDVTYTYDQTSGGNVGVGRLTNVTEESGSSSFTYDAQGRMTADAKVIQGRGYTVAYGYDGNGKVTKITYPSGRIVNVMRTTDGIITGVTTQLNSSSGAVNVATSITHAPFGGLTGLAYGNGLALIRTYDQDYQLTRIQVTATGVTPLDLGFQYYDDGRMGEIDDNAATGRTTYISYTTAGQLNYAGGPWGDESYAYDAAYNRIGDYLTVGGTTTSNNEIIAGASNQLSEVVDDNSNVKRAFTWRAGGDLYSDAITGGITYTYAYNARKRIVQVLQNGTSAGTYGYDFLGRRVWRETTGSGAIESHYIFDPQGHLLAEHDGSSGAVLKEYIWLDDLPVAVIDSTGSSPATYYIHTGIQDEPLQLTDASQALAWNAYGNPWGWAQTFSTATETIDLRLPGQWYTLETNSLNQNHNREYNPSTGRYIEADFTGIAAGQNLYAYVNDDPYDLQDPEGTNPVGAFLGGILGGVGAAAGSVVVDAGTGGINILATPQEILLGAAAGAVAGDWLTNGPSVLPTIGNGGAGAASQPASAANDNYSRAPEVYCPLVGEIACPYPGGKRGLYQCPDGSRRYLDVDTDYWPDKPLPPFIAPYDGRPMGIK
jgi:RHS repeat-associated protein